MHPDNRQSAATADLDPSLLIGVPSIDREHRALVWQLNRLLEDTQALPQSETFSEVLSRLGEDIGAHFDSEEGVLKSCGMPGDEIAKHVQAHDEILEQYTRLSFDLMEGKALARTDVLLLISRWIIDHLLCYDIKIRTYISAPQLPQRAI